MPDNDSSPVIKLPYISVLNGIPSDTPAFARAHKILSKAAKAGFRWPNAGLVLDKITEELDEVKKAAAAQDKAHTAEEIGDVLSAITTLVVFTQSEPITQHTLPVLEPHDSDALLAQVDEAFAKVKTAVTENNTDNTSGAVHELAAAVVAFANYQGIDAEAALQRTNDKFVYRFDAVSKELHHEGLTMETGHPNSISLGKVIGRWNTYKDVPENAETQGSRLDYSSL